MSENITEINKPKSDSNSEWYYSVGSHHFGPVSEEIIADRIKKGEITKNSLIRTEKEENWHPITKSKFADFMKPVKLSFGNNLIIWLLAFSPVMPFFLTGGFVLYAEALIPITAPNLFDKLDFDRIMLYSIPSIGVLNLILTVLLNIVLAYQDKKNLEIEGYNTNTMGNPRLIPGYLFKRADFLRHRGVYAIIWTLLFFLSILLTPFVIIVFAQELMI